MDPPAHSPKSVGVKRSALHRTAEPPPRWLLGLEPAPTGKILRFAAVLAIAAAAYFLSASTLEEPARRMLVIFLLCAGFWLTELVEPYATALLGTGLMILLLSLFPAGPTVAPINYETFLRPVASPVIVLFFGGFVLALAAKQHGLDKVLADRLLRPFTGSSSRLLLGVISVTALLSMWMSNTATAAMMLAVMLPIAKSLPDSARMRTALVLGVAFGANIGGMATIIGSPPNAIAALALSNAGHPVRFFDWMLLALPLVVVALLLLWLVLRPLCDVEIRSLDPFKGGPRPFDWRMAVIVATFSTCVLLWIGEPLHGIPAAVVALLPVVVFTFLSIIRPGDLARLDWSVLLLVAGGIALGDGMKLTGLSDWMVGLLPLASLPPLAAVLGFSAVVLVISNFMSNSAAAALVIPLVLNAAHNAPESAAMCVALSASAAMSLPVSTPPNALAHSTGMAPTRDMRLYGTLVSLLTLGLIAVLAFLMSRLPLFPAERL
jgi:sodium-dependent dicarboxylate transporter 2/3/5